MSKRFILQRHFRAPGYALDVYIERRFPFVSFWTGFRAYGYALDVYVGRRFPFISFWVGRDWT